MNKLLVISGPTATGKTSLALRLAQKLDGEIVSADSRQVYKGMDIGTGKDIPQGAKIKYPWFGKYGFYEVDGIKIWGYDLVDPRRDFSVSKYLKFANEIIFDIQKRGKLPILVGGTGLYIKGVIDGIATAEIPRNEMLRRNLEERSTEELYETLANLDSVKAGSLNSSDKKNPRRLIRAIEVAQYQLNKKSKPIKKVDFDVLFIALKAPQEVLNSKIKVRITQRIDLGIRDEIRKLLRMGVTWDDQSMVAMGYGQWRDYFEGGVGEEQILTEWERAEEAYAKRQMVWFKKDKRANWFDVTNKYYPKNVEKLAERWYKRNI